jgi:HEAT repeat protein
MHVEVKLAKLFWSFIFFSLLTGDALAWHGKVVDKATGAPIEGAVIARSWFRQYATVAGAVSSSHWTKETLTDNRGEFTIYSSFYFPGIPILTWVNENRPIVYKPGYKYIILNDKISIVELEKIPTYPTMRKDEVNKLRNNYEFDIYSTNVLMNMISREEEFLEILSSRAIKRISASVKSVQPLAPFEPSEFRVKALSRDIDKTKAIKTQPNIHKNLSKEEWVDSYIRILTDHSMAVVDRRRAASALGTYKDPKAVLPLIGALSDKNDFIRRQALESLKQIQDPRAVPAFINALSDHDPGLRIDAIWALGVVKDPIAIPAIIKALSDENKQVRHGAIELLKKQYNEYHVIESLDSLTIDLLIGDLGSKNINIQTAASYCLIEIGAPAVEQLVVALKNNDKNVRREAALALGRIHDPRAIEPLIIVLNANEDGVPWAAAQALFELSDYKNINAVKALISALAVKDDRARGLASGALVKMGSFALDEVIMATKSSNVEVRGHAVLILGRIKDLTAVETLLIALEDTSPEVRKNAAIAFTTLTDPRAIKPLISAWNDTDLKVRAYAAAALVAIGPTATDQLLQALKSKDSYFRWKAAWCLGRIKDQSAVASLMAILNDKVTEVQWIAIDALSNIGEIKASDELSKLCHAADAGIGDKAGSVILELTGKSCQ